MGFKKLRRKKGHERELTEVYKEEYACVYKFVRDGEKNGAGYALSISRLIGLSLRASDIIPAVHGPWHLQELRRLEAVAKCNQWG